MAKDISPDDDDLTLFHNTVGPVRPLRHDRVMPYRRALPSRLQEPTGCSPQSMLNQMSVAAEAEGLEAHDRLWFARSGLQQRIVRRLRRGQLPIAAELDLHGLSVSMAQPVLAEFLHHGLQAGHRCVRIIHGKGLGTGHKQPVLKNKVNVWLRQLDEVLAFCSARPADGGCGAVHVLLRKAPDSPTNDPF